MPSPPSGSLYGIDETNSNRTGTDLWGKNQFNSTFPLALCLYMRDSGLHPVAVLEADGDLVLDDTHWTMGDVIGQADDRAYYVFESSFAPFEVYSRDAVDKIDLIVEVDDEPLRPLEVKLTVVPDSGTADLKPDSWSPELVMRPVSSSYAMMSVAAGLSENAAIREEVMAHLRCGYNSVNAWDNPGEIVQNRVVLQTALDQTLRMIAENGLQRPFLMQPIWRTQGQSIWFEDNCFDVFVWSDAAVMRLPLDQTSSKQDKITRPMREVARHVRALYDVLSQNDYSYLNIYKGMSLQLQTDKSFSLAGRKTLRYLAHDRLIRPMLSREAVSEIIKHGGEQELKPERRFDAAVLANMSR